MVTTTRANLAARPIVRFCFPLYPAIGWLAGGAGRDDRRTLALTTSLRNVGVGLVIATGNFAGTPAVSAALAYGIVEVFGSLAMALWWGGATEPAGRSTSRDKQ